MPRLLDLFCCQGGASAGYVAAGFEVVGVDVHCHSLYPFELILSDAIKYVAQHGHKFDAIHASPPCQSWSAYRRKGHGVGDKYPDLIAPTRAALIATGRPWVIENVPGAPLENPVRLCGSMFGLDVRRHRLFESNFTIPEPPCDHRSQQGSFAPATNRTNRRKTCEIGVWRIPLSIQKKAMGGCEWMDLRGLSQAIPPAYTEHIGRALMKTL